VLHSLARRACETFNRTAASNGSILHRTFVKQVLSFVRPYAENPPIGWIGTGVMGHSMPGYLLAAGIRLTITTRTRAKAEPLIEPGCPVGGLAS